MYYLIEFLQKQIIRGIKLSMEFIADLHLHSNFSRATAKNLDLEHIFQAAIIKGITVAGTGDFTHPLWFKELEDKLEPAEDGLLKLKDGIVKNINNSDNMFISILDNIRSNSDIKNIGRKTEFDKNRVRFILQCEISSIYKKDGRVRKNHNLIYFPDMQSVRAFNEKLGKIGNITSDGRPILGLDCEKLLEIMLETSEHAFMIPAHIWTPWFSMFGSKSGFDSVEECFGSLAHHIFAVETGLSSDLPMNWRVENLDRMSFISCSDAHSPMFIGRNASCFNSSLSYKGIRDALKMPFCKTLEASSPLYSHLGSEQQLNDDSSNVNNSYLGTIDMYPQEGKYHYDGHRKCNVCFNPSETLEHNGICPKCGKPLTLGVLYRVEELASRPEGYTPENRHGYQSIIPLAEILSEICQTGSKTKKVDAYYTKAISALGPELEILLKRDIDEIERAGIPLLSEAIKRMRNRQIHLSPGYDGEFGRVTLFTPEERERLKGSISMFKMQSNLNKKELNKRYKKRTEEILLESDDNSPDTDKLFVKKQAIVKVINKIETKIIETKIEPKRENLINLEQQKAINSTNRPLIMEAGPGTGKTHTLTQKIASIIKNNYANPESILALTFTTKAAQEMRQRIENLISKDDLNQNAISKSEFVRNLPQKRQGVFVSTFHGFCLMVLKEYTDFKCAIADDILRKAFIQKAVELAIKDNTSKNDKNNLDQNELNQNNLIDKIDKKISLSAVELQISMIKQGLTLNDQDHHTANIILQKYQELLSSYQLVDFDDLILIVLELLQKDNKNNNILDKLRNRFTHIFVDEYQDINKSQYQLLKLIAGSGQNLCVIGDPDQSIYGFRGADNKYFNQFGHDYPNSEKIVFKRNYRSTETILEASFQLISNKQRVPNFIEHNFIQDKSSHIDPEPKHSPQSKERLFSGIQGEQHINIVQAASEESQAVMVGKTIEHLVGGISMFSMDSGKADSSIKDEYSFADIAVLYRTKKQSEVLSKAFEKAGIPFQTADRENIFLQKGIKELISCLRIFIGKETFYDLNVLSSYSKKISDTSFQLMRDKTTLELLKAVIELLGLDKILNKNRKIVEIAELFLKEAEKYPDPALFYEQIAMKRDIDTVDYGAEKVSLMTMHASKGLEFKVVFIAGCENGLIPFFNQNGKCDNIDEERRLFYVAMTRAKELLYLCHAKKRQIFGKTVISDRSPFLDDIEESLKQYNRSKFKKAEKTSSKEQLELF